MTARQAELRDAPICVLTSQAPAALFDHAFDLMKSHFAPILLLVAVVFLPLHLIEQYIVSSWLNPRFIALGLQDNPDNTFQYAGQIITLIFEYIPSGYPRFGIPGAMLIVAALFTSAPVSAAVADIIARRPVSVVNECRAAWDSRWELVWFSLLAGLSCFAVWFVTTMVTVIVGFVPLALVMNLVQFMPDPSVAGWITLIYLLICLALPFIVTCLFYGRIFAFVIPVCVNEGASIMGGVTRSQQLAACVPYRTTLLNFTVLPLAVIVVQFMLIFGCSAGLQLLHFSPQWEDVASAGVCALVVCTLNAYWMVYITGLYYDYRIKRECLDIRMLMATEVGYDPEIDAKQELGN